MSVRDVLRSFLLAWMAGTCVVCTAAEKSLPKPGHVIDGLTPAPATVVEPHRSTPLKPVDVSYTGYPVVPLLDGWLGEG